MVALLMSGMTRSYMEKILPFYDEAVKAMGFSRWLSESKFLYDELLRYHGEHPELATRVEKVLETPP